MYNKIYSQVKYIFFFTILFISCNNTNKEEELSNNKTNASDSINILILKSRIDTLKDVEKIAYINKAYELLIKDQQQLKESQKIDYLFQISNVYKSLNDTNYYKILKSTLSSAKKIDNKQAIANCYLQLGDYFFDRYILDAAYIYYVKAQQQFADVDLKIQEGVSHHKIGLLKSNTGQYLESVESFTRAVNIFEKFKEYDKLFMCYMVLGNVSLKLKNFDIAFSNYNLAFENFNKSNLKETLLADLYIHFGLYYYEIEHYSFAIQYFTKALEIDSLYKENPKSYANALNNIGMVKLQTKDFTQLPELFYKSLKIKKQFGYNEDLVITILNLAEYHSQINDEPKAILFAKEAYSTAKSIGKIDGILTSLKLLSKIDSTNKSEYLEEYLHRREEMLMTEKTVRFNFAQLIHENFQLEEKNKELSKRNVYGILGILLVLLIATTIIIIVLLHLRNVKLKMEQEKQKSDKKIYDLIVSEQIKLEEGRQSEKDRISLLLHDGILSQLFGLRLKLEVINDKTDKASIKERQILIKEISKLENEIRNISHNLKSEIMLEDIGFIALIEDLIKKHQFSELNINLDYNDRITWNDLNINIKLNLYMIILESMQNIIKHANAKNAYFELVIEEGYVYLNVKDDGIGYDVKSKYNGIGLRNIRERINSLGGIFNIKSVLKKGTTLFIQVPQKNEN